MAECKKNKFEILLNKVIELSEEKAFEKMKYNSLFEEYNDLEKDLDKAEKAVDSFKELADLEKNRAIMSENKFNNFHKNIMLFFQKKENPMAADILKVILIIMLKDKTFSTSKDMLYSYIKIYRHITGEPILKCKEVITDIIKGIDSINVETESINELEIKEDVKTINGKTFNSTALTIIDKQKEEFKKNVDLYSKNPFVKQTTFVKDIA